jgi:hypothetical protein
MNLEDIRQQYLAMRTELDGKAAGRN